MDIARDSRGSEPNPVPEPRESPELRELIEISRTVGSDPDLVQGGGGNTSVKTRDGTRMFVKASGTPLSGMDPDRGWAEMDLPASRAILRREGLAALPSEAREAEVLRLLNAAVRGPRGARPSVETSLHAILDRVVIHVHAIHLNAFLCSRDSREAYASLFRELGVPVLYVPYVDPGYTLAARLDREIEEFRSREGRLPAVVLLENHGVFVAAPEVEPCVELTRRVTEVGRRWAGGARVNEFEFPLAVEAPSGSPPMLAELRGALLGAGVAPHVLRRDTSELAGEFLRNEAAVRAAGEGAFTPDQIVYARTRPLVLEGTDPEAWTKSALDYRARTGVDPRVIIGRPDPASGSAGCVCYAAPDLAQLRVVAEVYRGAMTAVLRSSAAGGPRFLTREESGFIEGWEVEHYRAALLGSKSKRLQGRIAVVTGAGSGLGLGIARGLIEAGAVVFACDVNAAALESVRQRTPGYVPRVLDVTNEDSVGAGFRALEASLGGIDILVNAAGIAPPYSLVDFPLAAWRKTLEINLTGYFLCAREAARVLLRQGRGGSIVNLTSKSGLDASKDNSAYNATKAGEIHLARGWALELGRAGIRVNCVAPGNVFKGSQIWNDEYIRVCARKKGIEPEEVIPYYNSLTALNREIEPQDIANAVVFLCSDEARRITGQTLVVDGGQVMVR